MIGRQLTVLSLNSETEWVPHYEPKICLKITPKNGSVLTLASPAFRMSAKVLRIEETPGKIPKNPVKLFCQRPLDICVDNVT